MAYYDKELQIDSPYNVVFLEVETTPYCRNIKVVDIDTGVVLAENIIGDYKEAFANGYNACAGEFVVTREQNENGFEYRTVTDPVKETIFCGGWAEEGRHKKVGGRKRGGKKSYVKLHPEKLAELSDSMLVRAIRLSGNISTNGNLVNPKNRRKLGVEELANIWGVEKRRAFDILGGLKEAGVIESIDDHYRINSEFLGRG